MGPEEGVQLIEDETRLDPRGSRLGIEIENPVQVLGNVDDDGLGHRLAALRSAAAPGQDRHPFVGGDFDDADDVPVRLRHDDADGLDLVMGSVRRVAPTTERIEHHLAFDRAVKAPGQRAVADGGILGGWTSALGGHNI